MLIRNLSVYIDGILIHITTMQIVLAQVVLDTGWFKSSICRNRHHLFVLTNPWTKT